MEARKNYMSIKIIKPIEKYVKQMVKIADEARQHHIDILNGYFKPVTPVSSDFEEKIIRNHMTDPTTNIVFIAIDDQDHVIGMILGEKLHKPWLVKSRVGHVSNFIVSDAKRGQGIGKKLMDAFVNECRQSDIQEIELGVYNKNVGSYDFYIKYGFEPIEQKMHIEL